MLARLMDRLPIGPAWSYEVKWDGLSTPATYPAVAAALRTLSAHRALLDAEIVALDGEGHPSFKALQHRTSRTGQERYFDP